MDAAFRRAEQRLADSVRVVCELYRCVMSCALLAAIHGMIRIASNLLGSAFHDAHQESVAAWQVRGSGGVPGICAAKDVFGQFHWRLHDQLAFRQPARGEYHRAGGCLRGKRKELSSGQFHRYRLSGVFKLVSI